MGVADEKLLITYLETKSLVVTSKKLRLQRNYCGSRINKMRKAGVEIPRFSICRPRKLMDVERLKKILHDLGHNTKTKKNKKKGG